MTYLQDKKRKRDLYVKVSLCILAFVCFLFGANTIRSTVLPVSNKIFGTSGQVLSKVGSSFSSGITTKSALQERIRNLEEENQNFKLKQESYLIQESELQGLRQALAISDEGTASVFGKIVSARSVYGTFLIKTEYANVKTGDMVIDALGGGLGVVSTISDNTIMAIGFDSLKDPVSLYLLDADMTLDALKHSRGILMARVPREAEVQIGEVAVFSGTQIKAGTVVDFSKDEKDPFKEVYIRMSAKPTKGAIVGIVNGN